MNKQAIFLKYLSYLVVFVLFNGFSLDSIAQDITVSGVVKDAKGETMPGVTIVIKETIVGTTTDLDGKYSISVPSDATLVFSSIGYKKQIVLVSNRTKIDLVLNEDVEALDEVVVVGYGTVKRSHLTGSVSKVKNEKLDQIPLGRVDDALQGQIAGVNIQQTNPAAGEAPVIRIRGQGSISFGSDPLIVLDGIVVGNDGDFLASLDMNDVESVEVLKDASSGAIYGSRGANGIIMITTKKGVEGPTKFSYNGYVGFKDVPKNDVLTSVDDWLEQAREGGNGELSDRLQFIERVGQNTDWEEVMMDGGMIQSHSISAKGGTKNTKFTTSMSYLNDEGVLLTDNYEKINFKVRLTTQLRDKIKFGLNLNPSHIDQVRFPVGVHDAIRQSPWLPLYLDEDNIQFVNRFSNNGLWADAQVGDYAWENMFVNYDVASGTPVQNGGVGISTTSNASALAKILEREKTKKQTKVYANTFLQYDISEDFFLKQTFGGDFRYTKVADVIGVEGIRGGAENTRNDRDSQVRWHTVSESTANYKKKFGDHNFNVVAGFAFETWRVEESVIESGGFGDGSVSTITAPFVNNASTYEAEEKLISYLSRFTYDYKDRYLLAASIRRDGSSKFGTDSKFGWFPAISAGWIVNKENFFPENKILNTLKVRASYGITGSNSGIGEYDYIGLLDQVGTGFGQVGFGAVNIQNNDLRWEKLQEFNPGIDASFLGNKINLSFDYYDRISKDLLLEAPIPSVTGFSSALVNRGAVQNRGIEIELMTRNYTTRDFSWSTQFILTRNVNTLLDFADSDGLISISDEKRPAEWIALEGNPISSFYGYVVEKEIPLEFISEPYYPINGQSQDIYVKDLNGDGVIDTDDRTILGSPFPDFVWSVNNNFKYKNWDASFMFQGSHGAEVRNIASQYLNYEESSAQDFVPGFEDADQVAQRIFTSDDIQDASYIALRNLNIGYSFSVKVLKKVGVQKFRVYFAGQNLIYKWADDYEGYNPEGIDQGLDSPLTYGYQRGPAPIYRSYSFGVNLDF